MKLIDGHYVTIPKTTSEVLRSILRSRSLKPWISRVRELIKEMSDIEDSNKKEYNGPHSKGTEKLVSRLEGFRYQTVYPNSIDNLGKHLIGRALSFELTNNKVVTGRMKSFGQYDLIVTDSKTGQDILVMKSAIVSVQGDLSPKKEMI